MWGRFSIFRRTGERSDDKSACASAVTMLRGSFY